MSKQQELYLVSAGFGPHTFFDSTQSQESQSEEFHVAMYIKTQLDNISISVSVVSSEQMRTYNTEFLFK